jgi:hypothetical protein
VTRVGPAAILRVSSSRPAERVLTRWVLVAVFCPGGYDSFGSCMHWGPYFALDSYPLTCQAYTLPKGKGTFNDDFHVFGLYWDEVRGRHRLSYLTKRHLVAWDHSPTGLLRSVKLPTGYRGV